MHILNPIFGLITLSYVSDGPHLSSGPFEPEERSINALHAHFCTLIADMQEHALSKVFFRCEHGVL